MAIALPPPIEPQLVQIADLRSNADTRLEVGPLKFEIADECRIGTETIRAVAAAAHTPSDIVRGLGAACYEAGWPAERTIYAVQDTTIYVTIRRGRLSAVEVPYGYHGYFDGLQKHKALRQSQLEAARALADSVSERGGRNYELVLEPDGNEQARLVMKGPTPGRGQAQGAAGFATSGNRYSGRYIADAQLRLSAASGTELTLGGAIGVRPPALRNEFGGPYHEATAGLSQITPLGVFGIDGRYVDFSPTAQAVLSDNSVLNLTLLGHIREAGASWLDSLYASYNARVNLTLRVASSEELVRYENLRLLSEHYIKANATLGSINRFAIGSLAPFELQTSIDVGHGFTSRPFASNDPADPQYTLVRPLLRLSYGPFAGFTPAIQANAQFASSTLPQQEQFVLGGPQLHAYEAGTFSGDQGYGGRLTLDYGGIAWSWLKLKPTLFAEYGAAKLRHPIPGRDEGTAQRRDVGLELGVSLGQHVTLDGYVAEPLKRSGPSAISDDVQRIGAHLSIGF